MPSDTQIETPHRALFEFVFSQPEHAASLLRTLLPEQLARRIDWPSLALQSGSLVDEALKYRHTDLLFTARCDGRQVFLYLLLEHQSSSDPLMPFRLLRYMVRIWDRFLEHNPRATRLPAIVPVVVHHDQAVWSAPRDLHALVDLEPELLETISVFLPQFRFILDELAQAEDEAFRGRALTALAKITYVLLSRGRGNADIVGELRRWWDVLGDVLRADNSLACFSALWHYAWQVADAPPDAFRRLVQQLGPAAEEAFMTTAQQLTQQTRQESLAEGEARALLRVLRRRDIPVTEEQRARILACTDVTTLETWLDRAVVATTAEDVLA